MTITTKQKAKTLPIFIITFPQKIKQLKPFYLLNCSYHDRSSALDETSKCVKLYCVNKYIEDFEACYGRCLRLVVQNMASTPESFLTPSKRQVDPLQSCIEAKCAGMHKGHYGNCIYRRCITGVYKTAKKRISINDLVLESSYMKPTSHDDDDIFADSSLENDIKDLIKEHQLKLSDLLLNHLRTKAHNTNNKSRHSLTLYDILPRSSPEKRSWNDIVQNCIMYHCRNKKPGTAPYNVCVQVHCSKVQLGRRESRESSTEENDVK